ncbi:MAG: efflux RND transporter periplasmic adaptor subunit [Legionella sp.]|uniref:efflux RND transporter periplasmic adaptor subunit n=1 Tax=Legionella sp. TaxID=459 RepID=UPI00284ECB58|nr:efflux RND transporter periplasmic adaptor subunit [Legionella sp.]
MRFKLAVNTLWKSKKWLRNLSILMVISLAVVLSFYLFHRPASIPKKSLKVVETTIVKPTSLKKTIKLIGTIHPKHATLLTAKAPGLLEANCSSGQAVKKGDLIAQIINPEVEKNYQLSKDTAAISEAHYNRFLQLKSKGFVSIRELEEKKQQWINAQKEAAKTKNEVENLRFYSPFDGIVSTFKIRDGSQVKTGDVVVTVYDPLNIAVDLDIPCHYLHQIKEKQIVYIKKQKYHLSHLQQMMDAETHMCPAEVDIRCDDCIIGDTIYAKLLIKEKKQVLVAPVQALFLKEGKLSLYKVINNRIELVNVKSGIKEKDTVEIISGLKPNDQVIIKNPERLSPEMDVSIYQPKNKIPG